MVKISEICGDWDNSILLEQHVLEKIAGYEKVIDCFGFWPSLEDSEVIDISMTRGHMLENMRNSTWSGVWPEASIVLAQVVPFDSHNSKKKLRICFEGLHEILLNQFGYQNSICGMGIEEIYSDRLKKKVISVSWGGGAIPHEGYIQCDRLSVKIE